MSDIILKGKGVWYLNPETGKLEDQSFPSADSDHESLSHFHINSRTGKPFNELIESGLLGLFPMDIAARIMARELMESGYTGEGGVRMKPSSEGSALKTAKDLINRATKRFNAIKRQNGDDFHILPTPFGDDGSLHPDYKNNHYGGHEHKRIPTAQRKVRTSDGKLINNHARNETHPELGQHLESAALHAAKEIQDEAKAIGLETTIGAQQNVIEPQQITNGVTHRYTSNDKDPTSRDNTKFPSHHKDLHEQSAAYGRISPMDIVSILPSDFFVPSSSGGMSSKVMRQLQDNGYSQETARQMARAPVNQLLYGRGKDGAATGLRKVMRNLRAGLQIDSNDEVHAMFRNHRDHVAPMVRGGDKGRNTAAIEILAMMKTAEQLGVDPNQFSMYQTAPGAVVSGWRDVALQSGGKQLDMEALGMADTGHSLRQGVEQGTDHRYDEFPAHLSGGALGDDRPVAPVMPEEPMSAPPAIDTTQEVIGDDMPITPQTQPGFFANPNFNPLFDPSDFQFSDDDPMGVIANIMERVQLHDAGGSLIVKYDPLDAYDMQQLSNEVGVSSATARAIAMSLGDWGVIAKSFNTTHDVVRAIKRSCGGALNG